VEIPPAAEALFALPPSRFAGERDALARTLAARGDPTAAAVRKLRRPVGLAWVLNRLAREHGPDVRALLEAGGRLRAGQRRALSGGGADELREAEGALRDRVRALGSEAARILAAEGRPPAAVARIELLLRELAPAAGPLREALQRGVLAHEPDVGSGELSGFALLPGGRVGAGRPTGRGGGNAAARAERSREARERRERERELARLRRAAAEARSRAERAERAAAAAEETARSAREAAAQARVEARRARDRLATAERGDR
jgi:hypothetical protein